MVPPYDLCNTLPAWRALPSTACHTLPFVPFLHGTCGMHGIHCSAFLMVLPGTMDRQFRLPFPAAHALRPIHAPQFYPNHRLWLPLPANAPPPHRTTYLSAAPARATCAGALLRHAAPHARTRATRPRCLPCTADVAVPSVLTACLLTFYAVILPSCTLPHCSVLPYAGLPAARHYAHAPAHLPVVTGSPFFRLLQRHRYGCCTARTRCIHFPLTHPLPCLR